MALSLHWSVEALVSGAKLIHLGYPNLLLIGTEEREYIRQQLRACDLKSGMGGYLARKKFFWFRASRDAFSFLFPRRSSSRTVIRSTRIDMCLLTFLAS